MLKIGNAQHLITDELRQICYDRAKIFKERKRGLIRRYYNTLFGELTEQVFCGYHNIHQTDFSTPEFDAINRKTGETFEIKHSCVNSKTWNYIPDHYEYFFKCVKHISKIAFCYYDDETHDIFLKFIAEAASFRQFSDPSNSNVTGSTKEQWFYKDKSARSAGQCEIF